MPHVLHPPSPRNWIFGQQSEQKLCTSPTIVPHPVQRGGSAKSSTQSPSVRIASAVILRLSRASRHRTSVAVPDLFDMELRALRRDRAARLGPELFLLERAFEDCLDRISLMRRRFGRALLLGCPDPDWRERLAAFADQIDARDPGGLFAAAAAGEQLIE